MGLHFWLLPLLAIGIVGIWVFYMIIKHAGGDGQRSHGRTMLDKTVEEDSPPPG